MDNQPSSSDQSTQNPGLIKPNADPGAEQPKQSGQVIQPSQNTPDKIQPKEAQNSQPLISPTGTNPVIPTQPIPSTNAEPTTVIGSVEGQQNTPVNTVSAQDRTVTFGNNENSLQSLSGNKNLRLILIGGASAVLLVAVLLYFWILPASWSNTYLKNIKPSYQQQSSQMQKVYQDFNNIGTASNASVSAQQAYDSISGTIQTAINLTNNLESKNKLTSLPGTNWLHTVSLASSDHTAVAKYISDAQAFTQDYKLLIDYAWGFDKVLQAQIPAWISNTNAVNKQSPTPIFLTYVQTASGGFQSFINALNNLKPPDDLKAFNQSLLSDLNNMNNALLAQKLDLQQNNQSDFNNQKAIYVSAYLDFGKLFGTNPISDLKTTSVLDGQIKTVEADHPL